jgi:hypothetical protein
MTEGHNSPLALLNTRCCTRRTFLLSALLSLTAGGFGGKRYSQANSGSEPCGEPPWLRKTIANRQSAARIGRAYLDAQPEYRYCQVLLTDIERALKRQDPAVCLTMDAEHTARTLQGLLRKEYAHDEVISVAGWILSTTEARLYALVYLVTDIKPVSGSPP